MSRRAADLIGQIIRRADALSANTTLAPSVAQRLARLVSVHVPAPATLCTVRCPQRIRIRRDAALQLSRAVRQLQYRSRHYRATRHLRSGDGKEKGSLLNGVKEWKVKFDGSALHFPNHRDTETVEQIKRNTKSLAKRLSDATGEKIAASGIVALPGWYIEALTPPNGILALSPRQIRSAITSCPRALDSGAVQRAKYQLEQWCKLPVS